MLRGYIGAFIAVVECVWPPSSPRVFGPPLAPPGTRGLVGPRTAAAVHNVRTRHQCGWCLCGWSPRSMAADSMRVARVGSVLYSAMSAEPPLPSKGLPLQGKSYMPPQSPDGGRIKNGMALARPSMTAASPLACSCFCLWVFSSYCGWLRAANITVLSFISVVSSPPGAAYGLASYAICVRLPYRLTPDGHSAPNGIG